MLRNACALSRHIYQNIYDVRKAALTLNSRISRGHSCLAASLRGARHISRRLKYIFLYDNLRRTYQLGKTLQY